MNEAALSKISKVDCAGDADASMAFLRVKSISTSSASLLVVSLLRLRSVLPGHIFSKSGSGGWQEDGPMPLNYPLKASAVKGSDANYGAH